MRLPTLAPLALAALFLAPLETHAGPAGRFAGLTVGRPPVAVNQALAAEAELEATRVWLLAMGVDVARETLPTLSELRVIVGSPSAAAAMTPENWVHLGALPRLEFLELTDRPLYSSDAWLANLAGHPNLRQVSLLPASDVTDAGLALLLAVPSLESLSLRAAKVTAAGVAKLAGLARLATLDLAGADLGDDAVALIARFPALRRLAVSGRVTDRGVAWLSRKTTLACLSLGGSKLTDAGMPTLATLTGLTQLDLRATTITDRGLPNLYGLSKLEGLILRGTKVTAAGVAALQAKLPRCSVAFKGEMPTAK